MKVSLSWLKRFVDFKYSASELADKLTMQGFESEVVADFSALEHIVVGEVKSAKKHPDADKLKVCTVTDGKDSYNVVCGASNVDKGQMYGRKKALPIEIRKVSIPIFFLVEVNITSGKAFANEDSLVKVIFLIFSNSVGLILSNFVNIN